MQRSTMDNPRGPIPPTYDFHLREMDYDAQSSLVEDLADVADEARQIAVDLGVMPYTVHVVRIRWSGGEKGRGEPDVSLDLPLLPTPTIRGISGKSLESGGSVERGDVRCTGVSPRYTEEDLENYFGQVEGEEAFIEVRIDKRDGETKRRRYVLAAPPERRVEDHDWLLVLRKQDSDRELDGSVRPVREKFWR